MANVRARYAKTGETSRWIGALGCMADNCIYDGNPGKAISESPYFLP